MLDVGEPETLERIGAPQEADRMQEPQIRSRMALRQRLFDDGLDLLEGQVCHLRQVPAESDE